MTMQTAAPPQSYGGWGSGEPVLLSKDQKSAGGANEDVEIGPVPERTKWCLHRVAGENDTTAWTTLRIGIRRAGGFSPFEEQKSPAAATLYWSDQPYYLEAGQSLIVRFSGTTSGDMLHVHVNGVAMPL